MKSATRDVTPPASLKRKLQESKAVGLMPSALPGSYKPVPFWAAVVDKALSERGFWFEKRQYRAHVTLARRVITAGRCGATDPFKTTVSSFSLMLSERSGKSMVYTNVHTVNSCKNK